MTSVRQIHQGKTHLIGAGSLMLLGTVLPIWLWNPEPDPLPGWKPVNAEMRALLQETGESLQKTDAIPDPPSPQVVSPVAPPALDLNAATVEQLTLLPGIGPSKAKAILEYRSKAGKFHSVEELEKVKGIGPKTMERLRGYIFVGEQR